MVDIKECRKIKKDYTKKYDGKNIIFDLEKYPFVSVIITHGDGKSWGYFYDSNSRIYLGRSNQIMSSSIFHFRDFSISYAYNKEIIINNPEVERVYKAFIDYLIKICDYWWCAKTLRSVVKVNPVLFTNLFDSDCFRGIRSWNELNKFELLEGIDNYSEDFDFTKSLIKDVFHFPPAWIRVMFGYYHVNLKRLEYLKSHNYSPEEVISYGSTIFSSPEEYISNKEVTKAWCTNWTYRDYLNMRNDLPNDVKKNFPLLPLDVKKYHDKVVPVYNRNRILKKEKELQETQKKYEEGPYKEAIKYEYSDENYSIIACKQIIDLLLEGNALSHCVGSYTNSVSQGKEYILFLRKNSDIDTPYFTVDLTPEKQVRQIHGKCNCNMSSEIEPFVKQWAKKFKLNLTGCSGVKCALR